MLKKVPRWFCFLVVYVNLFLAIIYYSLSGRTEGLLTKKWLSSNDTSGFGPSVAPTRHSTVWAERNALSGKRKNWEERSSDILKKVMGGCHSKSFRVPNVIHYVWFNCSREFDFYHLMSAITTYANINPCAIIFHGDCEPSSKWWKVALKYIPSMYFVYHKMPNEIFGNKLQYIQHKAMVARLRILIKWGGIYFDDTVLGISSFNPLRNFSASMGMESKSIELLTSSIIVAEPSSSFVREWFNGSYHDYRPQFYPYNSGQFSYRLWKKKPDIGLYVELKKLLPIWNEWRKVWDENYPWKNNYAIHFVNHELKRLQNENKRKTPDFPNDVYTMDSAFGDICRTALKKLNVNFD